MAPRKGRTMQKIKVAAAQVRQSSDVAANCAKALAFMDRAAAEGVQILCFPEAHLPGYRVDVTSPDTPVQASELEHSLVLVGDRCRRHRIACLIGSERLTNGACIRNTVYVINEEGELLGYHDKTILTPLDAVAYTPGQGFDIWRLHGIQVGVATCFEGFRFAETTRACVLKGAQIVFHPQNNTTRPGLAWKLPVHEAMIVTRAAENTVFFVSVNMACEHQNSRSLMVGPDGVVIGTTRLRREELLVRDLDVDEATRAMALFEGGGMARMLFGEAVAPAEFSEVDDHDMRCGSGPRWNASHLTSAPGGEASSTNPPATPKSSGREEGLAQI